MCLTFFIFASFLTLNYGIFKFADSWLKTVKFNKIMQINSLIFNRSKKQK